jgi:hypothetical protein
MFVCSPGMLMTPGCPAIPLGCPPGGKFCAAAAAAASLAASILAKSVIEAMPGNGPVEISAPPGVAAGRVNPPD